MDDNHIRLCWSKFYFIVGVILLVCFTVFKIQVLFDILKSNFLLILWCSGCAAVGISLGLYNSCTVRNDRSKEHKHYYTYFIFAWFMATLAAFIAFGRFENSIAISYVSSAFVGIGLGFVADRLGDIIGKH